jgi:TM2 domain-containing membrane protein YozV
MYIFLFNVVIGDVMEQSKALVDNANIWFMTNQDKFPPEKMGALKSALENIDQSKLNALMSLDYKSPMIVFLLAFFLGGFSIDRFILGDPGIAVARFLTLQGLGVWGIIELCTSFKRAREYNFKLVQSVLSIY